MSRPGLHGGTAQRIGISDLIGDGDPELRRKVTQRQAVAVLMVVHVADADLLGRKNRQLAEER